MKSNFTQKENYQKQNPHFYQLFTDQYSKVQKEPVPNRFLATSRWGRPLRHTEAIIALCQHNKNKIIYTIKWKYLPFSLTACRHGEEQVKSKNTARNSRNEQTCFMTNQWYSRSGRPKIENVLSVFATELKQINQTGNHKVIKR